MNNWVKACGTADIDREDLLAVEIEGRQLAVYRSPDDEYFATDGFCTHEQYLLAEGLVMGCIIECPKHNGRFDYTNGQGKGAPIRTNLRTYATKVEGDSVFVDVE
jgi:3-phenylpropionate/trans-cinnamate dioxygenase ferredoxin component